MGIITHIVSFKYKESATSAERHLVASSFLALQSRCVDESGKSYIAVTGGKDNSPEGMSNGYDHTFVVTFGDEKARDYYVAKDEAHQKFKELALPSIEGAFVFDFEAGVF
ncbi:Dabb family protein [Sporobolomyces salmoneus]|uniref:Dabb family protein n=1 Tax=Sporobolomyces salmoneus TaxID=183962 RepID=UPI00316CFD3A